MKTFAEAVRTGLADPAAGEPEEQRRTPTEKLLDAAGTDLGKVVPAEWETLLPGRLGKLTTPSLSEVR